MKLLLAITALIEATTGLALMAVPAVVVGLLLGGELSGAGIPLGRVAGFALLSLSVACWPGRGAAASALRALLIYNALTTLFLLYLGVGGETVGPLLWPAVVLHAAMTVWCIMVLVRRPALVIEPMDRTASDRRP